MGKSNHHIPADKRMTHFGGTLMDMDLTDLIAMDWMLMGMERTTLLESQITVTTKDKWAKRFLFIGALLNFLIDIYDIYKRTPRRF
jgi:hypothetical protein